MKFKILILIKLLSCNLIAQNTNQELDRADSNFARAEYYYLEGNYDSAAMYFEKAEIIYKQKNNWKAYLNSVIRHSTCFQKKYEFVEASDLMKAACDLAIPLLNEIDSTVADAYYALGKHYYYQAKYDQVMTHWEKALQIRRKFYGEIHPKVASSYLAIGVFLNALGEYKQALDYFEKALGIRRELFGETNLQVAACYNNIGYIYNQIEKPLLALEYHLKTLAIRMKLSKQESDGVARCYYNIGEAYYSLCEYDSAIIYHLKSLDIRKVIYGATHPETAHSYSSIGDIYRTTSKFQLALEAYKLSMEILKPVYGSNSLEMASNYYGIGYVYADMGEYDLSLEYYSMSLNLYKAILGENHEANARLYNNIGNVYLYKNELESALQFYEKSIEITKIVYGDSSNSISTTYNNIGLIYYNMHEIDQALDYFYLAMELTTSTMGEENINIPGYHNNIGLCFMETKEFEKAYYHYKLAAEKYTEYFGEQHMDVSMSYNNLASALTSMQRYSEALLKYQQSIYSNVTNSIDTTSVFSIPIVKEYLNWENLLKSLLFKAKIYANYFDDLPGFDSRKGIETALQHYMLADTIISKARIEMRTKSDKISLGETASEIYANAILCCINLAKNPTGKSNKKWEKKALYYKELAFYFSEKNKSSVLLEALAGAEAQKFAGIPDSLLNKEQLLKIQIAAYKKILAEKPDSSNEAMFSKRLFDANRTYEKLIHSFEKQYPNYYELKYTSKPVTVSELQKSIDERTMLISYVAGVNDFTIFTISKTKFDVQRVASIENFSDTIRYFRNGLIYTNSKRFSAFYKKYAYKLGKILLPEDLEENGSLIIVPDAELCLIPFETLLTKNPEGLDWADLPYLIRDFQVSYSYSATLLVKTISKPSSQIKTSDLNDWIAFAPIFDDKNTSGMTMRTRELAKEFIPHTNDSSMQKKRFTSGGFLAPLPGTETEVQKIFEEFESNDKKAVAQFKTNANESFIKKQGLENFRLIHFATHGFVNTEKPELSGIFLAQDSASSEDGILFTEEIYNLKLNADLTVLSACETGLGTLKKGEGLIGLTRALLYAGSKNIIVSLWKVADESTSDLMIDFYARQLEYGIINQNYSFALQQAKLNMIDNSKYTHPFYWSPFILIGK